MSSDHIEFGMWQSWKVSRQWRKRFVEQMGYKLGVKLMEWRTVRVEMETVMRWCVPDEVNQESEQDEVDKDHCQLPANQHYTQLNEGQTDTQTERQADRETDAPALQWDHAVLPPTSHNQPWTSSRRLSAAAEDSRWHVAASVSSHAHETLPLALLQQITSTTVKCY